MEALRRTFGWVTRLEKLCYIFLMCSLVAVVSFGILVRYAPLPAGQMAWTEEITRLLLIWTVFLTIAWVQRGEDHFKINLIVDRLGFRLRVLLRFLCDLLLLACFLWLALLSARYSIDSLDRVTVMLRWPQTTFSASLLLSGSIMFIQGSVRLASRLRGYRRLW